MPGRKSNVSTTSNGPAAGEVQEPGSAKASKERDGISVEDLSLPKSMIARLAKGVLPANTQIHKDALLALHKSATVFVSYIASNANENTIASGKKTIAPHDVIAALKDSELEGFLPRLEAELKKYNDMQCDKRNTYRRKVKEEKAAVPTTTTQTDEGGDGVEGTAAVEVEASDAVMNGVANGHHGQHLDDEDRPVKKMKGVNGEAFRPQADAVGDDSDDQDDVEAGDEQDVDDVEDDADDGAVEDDIDDEEEDEDEDDVPPDETLDETMEEHDRRGGMVDEALDEHDSD